MLFEFIFDNMHLLKFAFLLKSSGALSIQIYLKLDRLDLAKKELKRLTDIDEDAIITQLSAAWVYIASVRNFLSNYHQIKQDQILNLFKGEKLQDAYFTFQELAEKNQPTSFLLNSQATCLINQGKYEEALSVLQEALDKVTRLLRSQNISQD